MNNVDKLAELGVLGAVRQRLGADHDHDTSFDKEINAMSSHRVVYNYAAWELGAGSYWDVFKRIFDSLETKN